jgi:hypothetical protein
MDIQTLVAELTKERDRIERAIAALSDIGTPARRPGRPVGSGAGKSTGGRTRRRHMSPAARKRISEMMKKRWAERKRKAKAA